MDGGRETRSDQAVRVLLLLAILQASGAIGDRKTHQIAQRSLFSTS